MAGMTQEMTTKISTRDSDTHLLIYCTSNQFYYLSNFAIFTYFEEVLNLICMKLFEIGYQFIDISATSVKLYLRNYFKIY